MDFSSAGIRCPELDSVRVGRHRAGRALEAERCFLLLEPPLLSRTRRHPCVRHSADVCCRGT